MEILLELHMLQMTRDQELQQKLLQQKEQLQQDIQELKQHKWLDKVQIDMEILLGLYMLQMELQSLLKLELPQPQLQERAVLTTAGAETTTPPAGD